MEAIGQLTGGIAHDFNNLLTGIIGSLEVIKRRIDLGRVDDLDRFMDAAINSANRAASLTQRLLAFSRQQSLDLKPVNINALILSLEDLLRRSIGAAIELIVELPEDVWIVEGDTSQIESALLNLVINARDAMPDGGVIRIKAVNLTILESEVDNPKGLERGDYVLVSVADNGSGMSQAVIDRAFDPFFTTKPIGQGTGLGLSMVYGYARQSKGHVQIDSDKERGTTIRFYMRRHTGALVQEQIAVRSVVLPTGRGETVLVVEDEPAVRQLIVEILNETGYRTLEAADGPSAISVLQSPQHIDLLISDVGLPGMNGRQVAEIGRKHRPDLKVLFVTGYAQHAAVRSEFLGPGMQMITKPFQADVLLIRVREMIGAN
ncbi:MAG: response regulator, partial [Hyphomicrobiales bacterium]